MFYSVSDEASKICDAAQAIERAIAREPEAYTPGENPTTSDYRLMAASNALDEARAYLDRLIAARRIAERVAA